MKYLILIDKNDRRTGEVGKIEAHLGRGRRHRAFTAILRNKNGEILTTRRSLKKPLWPTFWDVSFSSHPWVGESLEEACVRRAKEELGIKIEKVKRLFKYEYHRRWSEAFSEYEINHILLVEYNGKLELNPEEISECKWLKICDLKDEIFRQCSIPKDGQAGQVGKKAEIFAPWAQIAMSNGFFDKYL